MNRGMGEDEAEVQLDKVVVIFRYLQDKDVFENFYKVSYNNNNYYYHSLQIACSMRACI
jgi:Cullin family